MQELTQKVLNWAEERNLIKGSDPKSQTLKLMAEAGELADSINKGSDCRDDIGDCLVVLIILAAQKGLTISDCLAVAYEDIKNRKGIMFKGCFIEESDARYSEVLKQWIELNK